ncbi:unnamed protein product [Discosporangium mesarthrocarpum]
MASPTERPAQVGNGQTRDATVEALVKQAHLAVNRCEPELGLQFYQRALECCPDDISLMGEAAEVMLQIGMTDDAKIVLERTILLAPDEDPDKYLYMAQLHEGLGALAFFEKGLALLERDFAAAEGPAGEGPKRELKQKLCTAFCSVGELFMTDLCFEGDAEGRCQAALDKSLEFDCGGPEPMHALASFRLSQNKMEDAISFAEEAFRRLETCEEPPGQEFRISLAKILLECTVNSTPCSEKALQVLYGLMQEDDENVEVWYLLGVTFMRMSPAETESAR